MTRHGAVIRSGPAPGPSSTVVPGSGVTPAGDIAIPAARWCGAQETDAPTSGQVGSLTGPPYEEPTGVPHKVAE